MGLFRDYSEVVIAVITVISSTPCSDDESEDFDVANIKSPVFLPRLCSLYL